MHTYQVKYTASNMHAFYHGHKEVIFNDEPEEGDIEAKAIRLIKRDVGPGLLVQITDISSSQ